MIIVLVVAVPDNATVSVLTRLGACRQPGAEQTAAPAQDHLTV
jgi:hypothetical protein